MHARREEPTETTRVAVSDLVHGDETADYGRVTHREGRKVWFEDRIVTFPTLDEQLVLLRPPV